MLKSRVAENGFRRGDVDSQPLIHHSCCSERRLERHFLAAANECAKVEVKAHFGKRTHAKVRGCTCHPHPAVCCSFLLGVQTTVSQSFLFNYLDNIWEFRPGPVPNSCNLRFSVAFQFTSSLYRGVGPLTSALLFFVWGKA